MFYGFDPTFIILIPAIIFTVYAQRKVQSTYAAYSRVATRKGITGGQTARMILNSNGMGHVPIDRSRSYRGTSQITMIPQRM